MNKKNTENLHTLQEVKQWRVANIININGMLNTLENHIINARDNTPNFRSDNMFSCKVPIYLTKIRAKSAKKSIYLKMKKKAKSLNK